MRPRRLNKSTIIYSNSSIEVTMSKRGMVCSLVGSEKRVMLCSIQKLAVWDKCGAHMEADLLQTCPTPVLEGYRPANFTCTPLTFLNQSCSTDSYEEPSYLIKVC